VVGYRGDGRAIYLRDVAEVKFTYKDPVTYSRLNGRDSLTIAVRKRVGANIIDIADAVEVILAQAQERAPSGVQFELTQDQSDDIRMMVSDLENNILSGLILVVAVLLLFMGVKNSFIVGLAIPLSMLMSFAILQMLGYTLNMIVLFSLILALGMLVDNAIVIVENVYRHGHMGKDKVHAAIDGTAEVAWPVIASTATTIAAFTPLLFWPGMVGDFMKYLPITLIVVLSSSLFVAMIINPVICSLLAGVKKEDKPEERKNHGFVRGYRWFLSVAIRHRAVTLGLSICILVGIIIVQGRKGAGVEFFPELDPRYAIVNIRMPQGTNIDKTDELAEVVERRLEEFRKGPEFNEDVIENVTTTVGSTGGSFGGDSGPHVANVMIMFREYADREIDTADMIPRFREALSDIAGAEIKVEKPQEGPATGGAVAVEIVGEDLAVLKELSDKAMARLRKVPNLVNLRSDLESAKPEIRFVPDRERGNFLGVNTSTSGIYLRTNIFGSKVGDFRQFKDDYDITVRADESVRQEIEDMLSWRVPSTTPAVSVHLSSLGHFEYATGLGDIHRVDQQRVVTITGDAEGRTEEKVLADAITALENMSIPADYEVRFAGQKEEQDEAAAFLAMAFGVALVIIVVILVTQFNTISIPFIIMTTIALSTIGVLIGLLVHDMPFGIIMTGVGVISLAGVVVNNAIVLLDYTRQLQKKGLDIVSAAIEAGVTRLRPVLLTATTTILGLIPMAAGISWNFREMELATRSESSLWWRSMAIAVIYGLGFATVLTLVVVPSLYVMLFKFTASLGLGGGLHHAGSDDEEVIILEEN